jgi:5'-methylthioadenosine phosphorylase
MSKTKKIAVIGGSGIYNLDSIKLKNEHEVSTPFGKTSDKILELEIDNQSFYFLPRHGRGHFITPSEVNYRANIFALKKLGVNTIISVSAVGSLKEELPPKNVVLVDQFIDWTKGKRERSFFGNGIVGHVSTAYPIDKNLLLKLSEVCQKEKIDHAVGGSYICIEGPQFSSRAESEIYRSFGASVIGMTNVPESYLAKEAGIAYATVALVTDYDCWKDEHCTLEEIMKIMNFNYISAQKIITKIIPELIKNPIEVVTENTNSVVTNPQLLKPEHQEILKVLMNE